MSKDEEIELWHERLGHMNYRDLLILHKFYVVRGLPKLGKKVNGVCRPCQQGKQTKSLHKKGKYLSTKEPIEFLHMDLMGPMQTESLGGKRYIFVCVDDFSRNLWAEAINMAWYIGNRVFLRPGTRQTSYELWRGRKPNVSYFHTFGSKCYILNDRDQLGKFDFKSDEGIFIGY
ncbi:hypothetical protein QYF36_024817 [Acer negundo]|nr:hypothetical protein QYF36_024817 [Acer negundo]